MTAESVAKLRAQEPWRVRKRVRQVVSQVLSPQYAFVLRHRDDWPAPRRRVATACILQGRTLREASHTLKMSLHSVRTELSIVNALYEAERS